MNSLLLRAVSTLPVLLVACSISAQSPIDRLIEQTGIEVGAVPIREIPGWREPQKIVVRDIGLSQADFGKALPGVEVIIVGSQAEAIDNAAGADAVIGWCGGELMATAKDAVWVQVYSAGAERCMTVPRIVNGSVVLTNMQKMASPVIAEHVIALTLSLARKLPEYSKSMPEGVWLDHTPLAESMESIAGKTMLVAGLGGIGTEVARRAAALGMRVVGTRRSSREGPEFVEYVGLSDELFELAGRADFIINALPLTAETTGLYDKEFFMAARRGAYFISVGRGRSTVTDDLIAALASGQIAGAALDVTDPEPLPADHALWQMDNVIITPHVSSNGGNRVRHRIVLMDNLKRFKAGDALLNVVDPALGY